jgi:hypothetical protein
MIDLKIILFENLAGHQEIISDYFQQFLIIHF